MSDTMTDAVNIIAAAFPARPPWTVAPVDPDTAQRARDATPGCHHDPGQTLAWLEAVDHHTGHPLAAQLGIDDTFAFPGFRLWSRVQTLVTLAQAAHTLHLPGHEIDVLHLAGGDGSGARYRIALSTPGYGTLVSPDIQAETLLPPDLRGVDAALHLLGQVAAGANELLYDRARLSSVQWGLPHLTHSRQVTEVEASTPRPRRSFRPLAKTDPTATAATTPASTSRTRRWPGRR